MNVFSQIVAVFASPLGVAVLSVALLSIIGVIVWAYWKGGDQLTNPFAGSEKLKTTKPPLLAPNMFVGGASDVEPQDNMVRNILLAVLAVVGLFVVWQFATSPRDHMVVVVDDTPRAERPGDAFSEPPLVTPGQPAPAYAGGPDYTRITCDEGMLDPEYPVSYRLCAPRQAAQFDLITFERNGQPLLNPRWLPKSGYALTADNQANTFTLDENVEMLPAPRSSISNDLATPEAIAREYDAYIAIGFTGLETKADETAKRISSERGFAVGRYVMDKMRGDSADPCRYGKATLRAISLGAPTIDADGRLTGADASVPTPKPVLIGVKFDPRYAESDRNLDALISDFMRSQGVRISGFNMREFGPHQVLFDESVCRPLPL